MRRWLGLLIWLIVLVTLIIIWKERSEGAEALFDELCPLRPEDLSPHFVAVEDGPLVEELRDCEAYWAGRREDLVDEEEPQSDDFPIAYSVVVHKDLSQLEKLVRLLAHGRNLVCVSVDAKSVGLRKKVEVLAACQPDRLLLSPVERDIFWGGFSLLQATLDCARLLDRSPVAWRYFVNLSAQDFPLHTQRHIKAALSAVQPRSVVEVKVETKARLYEHRYKVLRDKKGRAVSNRRTEERKRPPPYNVTVMKGNLAVLLSRAALRWSLESSSAQRVLEWLADTDVADEHFFPSLFGNAETLGMPKELSLRQEGPPTLNRWSWWRGEEEEPCEGKVVHDLCVLGLRDVRRLLRRPPSNLFANKIYVGFQPEGYACLQSWLRRER